MPFLPIDREEMEAQGIKRPDFVLVTGDAYIDHPSFGAAIIGRILNRHGYSVCVLSQPDWTDPDMFLKFGKPRLAWLVTAGNIDSMVNHYTVAKRRRKKDAYTPGGKTGKRPDRASIAYSHAIRSVDGGASIVLGGIEASLRRLSHYDYWDDEVRRSILIDSGADILVYGMGEKAIIGIADALASGLSINDVIFIEGTVYKTKKARYVPDHALRLPPHRTQKNDKSAYGEAFSVIEQNTDHLNASPLVEKDGTFYIVQTIPAPVLSGEELDRVYDLPFMRKTHPKIESQGHVPAIDEVKFSLTANRGCFGGCSFCALAMHQGRRVVSRSKQSLVNEAKTLTRDESFKGYIHDVGGPTANFHGPSCGKQKAYGVCKNKDCIGYRACANLDVGHQRYLDILRDLRNLKNVKKVFIRSGIRFDYLMMDENRSFFKELVKHHVSGQLKVAPEHVNDHVLKMMNKPPHSVFEDFKEAFFAYTKEIGKEQYLIPYLISSHPGSGLDEAIELAEYLNETGFRPEQVQDFYPTPMTRSTVMFHTGEDPLTKTPVYVAKTNGEKKQQRALLQFDRPKNHALVRKTLIKAGRSDLIGHGKHCLVPPR